MSKTPTTAEPIVATLRHGKTYRAIDPKSPTALATVYVRGHGQEVTLETAQYLANHFVDVQSEMKAKVWRCGRVRAFEFAGWTPPEFNKQIRIVDGRQSYEKANDAEVADPLGLDLG